MSCRHGRWGPCEVCDDEEELLNSRVASIALTQLVEEQASRIKELETELANAYSSVDRNWVTHQSMVELQTENELLREAVREAKQVKKGLVRWRQERWPDSDQQSVIDKEFPALSRMIAKFFS